MTPQDEKIKEIGEIAASMIETMSNFISKHSDGSDLRSLINDLGYAIYQINQWFDYLKFQDAYFTLRNRELEDMNKALELEGVNSSDIEMDILNNMSSLTEEDIDNANALKNAAIIGSNWTIEDEKDSDEP